MAKKTAIDRAIAALDAKRLELSERTVTELRAMDAAIDVLKAQRRTPKPRVVKQPAAMAG